MNRDIAEHLQQLHPQQMNELRARFKDAPLMLNAVSFFHDRERAHYKNADAVKALYGITVGQESYAVAENRFFKLRRKLFDLLQQSTEKRETKLTEEEEQFFAARELMQNGQHTRAYKLLAAVEKKCEQRNIFELWVTVLDQMILCNQIFNRHELNEKLFVRLKTSITLKHDFELLALHARKIYEINFRKGMRYAKEELNAMARLAATHKDWPRFQLSYHFVSGYYKLASGDDTYTKTPNIISRHLRALNKLHEQHPQMPTIGYGLNYSSRQHYHFKEITAFFHYNIGRWHEAEKLMSELFDLVMREDSPHRQSLNETLFINMLHTQVGAENFKGAMKTAEQFIRFLQEHEKTDRLAAAYAEMANVYCSGYPETKTMNGDFLLKKLEEHIREAKKIGGRMDALYITQAKLYYLKAARPQALRILKTHASKNETANTLLLRKLFEAKTSAQFNSLLPEVRRAKQQADSPSLMLAFRWMERIALHKIAASARGL